MMKDVTLWVHAKSGTGCYASGDALELPVGDCQTSAPQTPLGHLIHSSWRRSPRRLIRIAYAWRGTSERSRRPR